MTEWCAIVGLHGLHDPPATMTHPRRGKGGCVIRMPSAIPRTDRIHVRYLCRGYGITTPPPPPSRKLTFPMESVRPWGALSAGTVWCIIHHPWEFRMFGHTPNLKRRNTLSPWAHMPMLQRTLPLPVWMVPDGSCLEAHPAAKSEMSKSVMINHAYSTSPAAPTARVSDSAP